MKKVIYFLIALCLISLSSCLNKDVEPTLEERNQQILDYINANNLTAQRTTSGVYYVVLSISGETRVPEVGDQLTLEVEGETLGGGSTTIEDPIVKLPFGANILNKDIEDVLELFKKGDKVKIFLSSANPVLIYDIEVQDIRSEIEQIGDYILAKELTTTQTQSGLEYVLEQEGDGIEPVPNGSIVVKYTLRDLEGNIIDQSSLNGSTFALSTTTLITGFYESVLLMNVGGKGKFIMPSSIAYGTTGNQSVLPYTPLEFEIELVSVN
jgi:FKBP-type peptidyl-prolyl cis-trans isomerase